MLASTVLAQQNARYAPGVSIDTAVPVLSVQTTAPAEISLGKTATYTLTVRNMGDEAAEVVVVQVALPAGAPLVDAVPSPGSVTGRVARFNLGKIDARDQRRIQLKLKPGKSGPLQLHARTCFATQSATAIQVRQARLAIGCAAPLDADYGDIVRYKLTVTNTGDGPAEGVVITPRLPRAAHLAAGTPLPIGDLAPGESRDIPFTANAVTQGVLTATFTAHDRMGHRAKTESTVRILRPMLNIALDGPGLRFLNRNGEYVVRITNPGDAPARNVKVVLAMPYGLKAVGTSRHAMFSKSLNTLTWKITELHPGTEATWSVYAQATEEGSHVPQIIATNEHGLAADAEVATRVVSRAQLYATVINRSGPLQIGEPAEFSVVVGNRGTRQADSVTVRALLPAGLRAEPASGMTISGQEIHFRTTSLAVGEKREFKFRARGSDQGDHVIRVTYGDGSSGTALAVEGRAFYYADPNAVHVAEKPEYESGGTTLLK